MNNQQIVENIINKMDNKGYELTDELANVLEFVLDEFSNSEETSEFLYSLGRTLNDVYGDITFGR